MQKSLHFLYHELRATPARYAYVTPVAEFEAHCSLFARLRTVEEAGDALYRPEITFDDGHVSDAELALPILERYSLKAHFFITAGWTGTRPGFMGWEALGALLAAGHQIGAHGFTHKLLTACSPAELDEELGSARRVLEDKLGVAITTMSLPGGRANGTVLRACTAAGYTQVFTSAPRAESLAQQPRTVGRLNLVAGTTTGWLERVLDPGSGLLASLARKQRLKAGVQRALGDRLYAQLWAVVNRQGSEEPDPGEESQGFRA